VSPVAAATLRSATPDDARSIAEVHVESWRWAYEGLLPASLLEALSVDERTDGWNAILADEAETVTVAVDADGRVVGFVSVGASRDDDRTGDTGEVYAIYLGRVAAGTGIGRSLLHHAEDQLREAGFSRATLWVLETNERARRFYERHGWAWDGARGEHRFDCGDRPIVRYARDL
jgi:GNAT superfamily N-acetyltransferase